MIVIDHPFASATPRLIGGTMHQRGASGPTVSFANPARYAFEYALKGDYVENIQPLYAKVTAATQSAIDIPFPLQVPQGSPGSPVVDGDVTGMAATLAIKGLTPGYTIKGGYWLHISNADGRAFLHNVLDGAMANDDGEATVTLATAMRWPFEDGDTIELAEPRIHAVIIGEVPHPLTVDKIGFLQMSLEEMV
jgi:hypothetical protein